MKKIVFICYASIFLLFSCAKDNDDDIPQLPESPLIGMWYLDTYSSTYSYKYTNKYKRYCHENISDTITFDESVYRRNDMHYAYWEFLNNYYAKYYYQYYSGRISQGKLSYHIDGYEFRWGTHYGTILKSNSQNFEVELRDTTYYKDEDDSRQIAWVQIIHNVFNRTRVNSPVESGNKSCNDDDIGKADGKYRPSFSICP